MNSAQDYHSQNTYDAFQRQSNTETSSAPPPEDTSREASFERRLRVTRLFAEKHKLARLQHLYGNSGSRIKWNPWNKVVQDHENGEVHHEPTNEVRAALGLSVPWTPETAEADLRLPGYHLRPPSPNMILSAIRSKSSLAYAVDDFKTMEEWNNTAEAITRGDLKIPDVPPHDEQTILECLRRAANPHAAIAEAVELEAMSLEDCLQWAESGNANAGQRTKHALKTLAAEIRARDCPRCDTLKALKAENERLKEANERQARLLKKAGWGNPLRDEPNPSTEDA